MSGDTDRSDDNEEVEVMESRAALLDLVMRVVLAGMLIVVVWLIKKNVVFVLIRVETGRVNS